MSLIIIIIFVSMLGLYKIFNLADLFSPWMLTTLVWTGFITMYMMSDDLLVPLGTRFYTAIMLWVPILAVSSILTYKCLPDSSNERNINGTNGVTLSGINAPLDVNKNIFNMLYVLSLLLTPLYCYQMLKLVAQFGTDDLVYNIRIFANYGKEEGGLTSILKYVNSINTCLLIMALWRYPKINRWQFYSIIIVNIVCALAIMAKLPLFLMLFATLFVFYQRGKVKLRTILLWSGVIILVFYGFNLLRQSENDKTENTLIDFLGIYILSPAAAFEKCDIDLNDQFGAHSLAFFNAVLSKLKIANVHVEEIVQPFVWVPLPTNVYTVMQPFYEDFGFSGVAFFATVYGTLFGLIFRKAQQGNGIYKCLYTYIVVILILQFFQEQFFLTLSTIIQLTVLFTLTLQQHIKFRWFDMNHRLSSDKFTS